MGIDYDRLLKLRLVVERKVLEQVGLFHGLTTDVDRYLSVLFDPSVLRFMPRPQAEKDPSFKQLIPYVIMSFEGKFLSYDQESQTFKIYVTSNRADVFGGSLAGAKAPADVKPRKEMTLSVTPTGSVLSRTVIKSVSGTGLDISGTQEGFSQAVKAIPRDYRVTFSITRNPETRSNPDKPAYHANTVIIQLSPQELEERWRKFSGGED